MKQVSFWAVLILIAVGLQILGRISSPAKPTKKTEPASVSKIEGTELKRLTLLPEAVRRLDIKTTVVREETLEPKQVVGGEVVSTSPDGNSAIVRVELTEIEAGKVRRGEPAYVLPLARDAKASRIKAQPLSGAIADTLSLDSRARRIKALPLRKAAESGLYAVPGTIHYEVSGGDHGLASRQLVFVELALSGEAEKRNVVPYASVLYDAKGNTWVYTNPEPNVFVRQPIRVETVVGNEALLTEGPPVGTAVVTVGGAELYGTEFGVGK